MKHVILTTLFTFIALPLVVSAQAQTLINLPGLTGANNFDQYINTVYGVFISIAALIAVVKIIIAGVKYMFSDIVTQKSDAKRDIRTALVGLLVIISAVLILTIINPSLTNFDLSSVRDNQVAVAPEDAGITEITADINTIEEFCSQNAGACSSQSCEYLGTDYFITQVINTPINNAVCETFCRGEVVNGQCLYVSDTLPVDLPQIEETIVMECPNGDCGQVGQVCENAYAGNATPINTDGTLKIQCSPSPETEIFQCVSQGRGAFNCDSAKEQCQSPRTYRHVTRNQIICER